MIRSGSQRRKRAWWLIAVLLGAVGVAAPAARADRGGRGDGETAYRANIRITTDFDGRDDSISALAVQPGGRLLAAGTATVDDYTRFALARYLPNGRLDPTFGGDGTVTTKIGSGSGANAMAVQPDGRFVLAGVSTAGPDDGTMFALARYLPTGHLDPTFGNGGTITTNFDGLPHTDIIRAVALQPDGNPDGTPDPTFGENGQVITPVGRQAGGQAVAIQPDGKFVVAGYGDVGSNGLAFAVARYHAHGTPDETLDGDGVATTDFSAVTDAASVVTVTDDGFIVAAGQAAFISPGGSDFAIVGFGPDLINVPTPTVAPAPAARPEASSPSSATVRRRAPVVRRP